MSTLYQRAVSWTKKWAMFRIVNPLFWKLGEGTHSVYLIQVCPVPPTAWVSFLTVYMARIFSPSTAGTLSYYLVAFLCDSPSKQKID